MNQNINIHILDEYVFRESCRKGHIEVAKWLLFLYDDYRIEEQNGRIIKYWVEKK
jgi:hypothetical protein